MTKTILLATVVAVTILGLSAASMVFNNSVLADEEGSDHTLVRDNVDVENIKLEEGQFRVLVDNAGIGTTSDVEITWVFDPENCVVIAAGVTGTTFGTIPLVNDGAFQAVGVPIVGHNDVKHAEAILLTAAGGNDCEIESDEGQFVAVSTVAIAPAGDIVTSNPPED